MLEDLALGFVNMSDLAGRAVIAAVALAGFAAGLVLRWRNQEALSRVPYFALCMALLLALIVALKLLDATWPLSIRALSLDVLWLLVAVHLIAVAAVGGAYGVLALGRARDAFASPWFAVLAFIPVANLALFFAPSREPPREPPREPSQAHRLPAFLRRAAPLLTGDGGLVSGVALLLGAALLSGIFLTEAQRAASDPVAQANQIALLIRTRGLEDTVRLMAAGARLPVRVDAVTTFAAIEAEGRRMRRIYMVDLPGFVLTDRHKASIEQAICTSPPLALLLGEGAAIEERYIAPDGALLGTHEMTQDRCPR